MDIEYVYGENNGNSYEEQPKASDQQVKTRTHWDPRISVRSIAGTVEVGITPPTPYKERDPNRVNHQTDGVEFDDSADDDRRIMEWLSDNGQFLTLSRSGINRLIEALRTARDEAYGKDA